MSDKIIIEQKEICRKYNLTYTESHMDLRIGIDLNIFEGVLPINGLRQYPENNTTGWYIWAGKEIPEAPDFFKPMCVRHLMDRDQKLLTYLGLPPGSRFLIAPEYEDVWFDENLLT